MANLCILSPSQVHKWMFFSSSPQTHIRTFSVFASFLTTFYLSLFFKCLLLLELLIMAFFTYLRYLFLCLFAAFKSGFARSALPQLVISRVFIAIGSWTSGCILFLIIMCLPLSALHPVSHSSRSVLSFHKSIPLCYIALLES